MNKNYISFFIFLLIASLSLKAQTTLTQWNFNGSSGTTVPGGTESPTPSVGAGTAALIGGVTGVLLQEPLQEVLRIR